MAAVARLHDIGERVVFERAGAVLKLLYHLPRCERVAVGEGRHAGVVGVRHQLVKAREQRLAVGFERAQLFERRLGLLADLRLLLVRHVGAVVVFREEEDVLAAEVIVVVRPGEHVLVGELLAVQAVGVFHDGVERGVARKERAVGRLVEIRALDGLHQRVHAAVLLHNVLPLRFDLGVHRFGQAPRLRLDERNGVVLHTRLERFAQRVLERRAVAHVGRKVGDRHGVVDKLARQAAEEIIVQLPGDLRAVHGGDNGGAVVLLARRVKLGFDLCILCLHLAHGGVRVIGSAVRDALGGRAGRFGGGGLLVGGKRRDAQRAEQQHKAHQQGEQFLCVHRFYSFSAAGSAAGFCSLCHAAMSARASAMGFAPGRSFSPSRGSRPASSLTRPLNSF